jgi:putative polyhydroxyalkanoate system protein
MKHMPRVVVTFPPCSLTIAFASTQGHSMTDIIIRRGHTMTPKKARQAAEKIAEQLDEEFDLAYEWADNELHFKRSGVSGELVVEKKEVHIRVRLGFLLLALKPRIEAEIHRYFDENFGPGSGPEV